ncbi:endonuclease [Mycobacterium phage Ekdilam]|uniref:Integrase n=1 Tax=Mycobacterium phage Ekdilam TaxID=2599862 RepID=A0A5J6TKD5_9CAUD|nr:endonuclease [Mycobacterium phage Ekdilam]QFG11463.1 tyrosine integrase [Mycobacterium phage Ekdilam]
MTAAKGKGKAPRRSSGDGGLRWEEARGVWVGRVSYRDAEGNRKQRKVYAKDRAEAAEKLRAAQADVAKRAPAQRGPSMTLAAYLDHWLENVHGDHVRQKTYRHYEGAIRLYIKPQIGHKRLDRLTGDDVRTMLRKVAQGSSRNAQKAHQALKTALKDAVPDYLDRNPCEGVKKPPHLAAEVEGFPLAIAQRILSTAEQIDAAADDRAALLAARWQAAFLTGAREGELLGLTWDRVDYANARLVVPWQLQRLTQAHGCGDRTRDEGGELAAWPCGKVRPGWCPERRWDLPPGTEHTVLHRSLVLTRPKTKAGVRVLPMIAPLAARLRTHQAATAHLPNPHNLVWHHADGRPIDPESDREAWHALMAAAEVPVVEGENNGLHRARHTTATLLLHHGVDRHVIAAAIGHSKASTTELYQHVDLDLARQAFDHLGALVVNDEPAAAPDGPLADVVQLRPRRRR